jgi:hypothetical protein
MDPVFLLDEDDVAVGRKTDHVEAAGGWSIVTEDGMSFASIIGRHVSLWPIQLDFYVSAAVSV